MEDNDVCETPFIDARRLDSVGEGHDDDDDDGETERFVLQAENIAAT